MQIGDKVTVKCKVTAIEGELARIELDNFPSDIGYWVPITLLEENCFWSQEEEDQYRMRHMS